jgi:LPS-assembly protein
MLSAWGRVLSALGTRRLDPHRPSPRRRLRATAWLVIAACWLGFGPPALAGVLDDDGQLEIAARSLEYIEAGALYIGEGEVRIIQGNQSLRADWVAFSLETRRGVASGNVVIADGVQLIEADLMQFDVDSLEGVIFEGEVDTGDGGFLVWARELIKHSDRDYVFRDSTFTTCRCEDEDARKPWRLRTERAEVELGGYGRAKNATVDVLGVPILWIPWIMYPVKTERETGLLFPEFAFGGSNGVQVGLPFFWAPRHDVGVIVTPSYLQERGAKIDVDVEYAIGEESGGIVHGGFVLDQSASPNTGYDRERWALAIEHHQSLPLGWRAVADLKAVSDNEYVDNFDDYGLFRRDVFLRSNLFAFNQFGKSGRVGVVAAMQYADDIQTASTTNIDRQLLQRLPRVTVRAMSARPGFLDGLGVVTGADTEYTYFFSRDGAQTLPGGLIKDNGHRLRVYPRIARPMQIGGVLDLYPELGYAETLYGADIAGVSERGLYTAQADLRARMRGGLPGLFGGPGATHLLEPYANWTWIEPRSSGDTPIFAPASLRAQSRLLNLEPENRVLNPADRIASQNVLSIGFDNRFRRPGRGLRAGRMLSELRVAFEHDFERDAIGRLIVDGRGLDHRFVRVDGSLAFDVEQRDFDEGLAGVRFSLPDYAIFSRTYLRTNYRYVRETPIISALIPTEVNQINAGFGFWLADRLQVSYRTAYSLDDRERLASRGSVLYASRCKCWTAGIDVVEDRTHDVFVGFRYTITGLGREPADFFSGGSSFRSLGR